MAGREFYDDVWLRQRVGAELAEAEQSASPDAITETIGHALDMAASDLRERAGDLRYCYKPDTCRSEAVVLDRLVAWLVARGAA